MSRLVPDRSTTGNCGSLRLSALVDPEGSEWARFDLQTFATSLRHLQASKVAFLQVKGHIGQLGAANRKEPHPRSAALTCSR